VCFRVLQCAAVCCHVEDLRNRTLEVGNFEKQFIVRACDAVIYSILQRVAVCCCVLQCVARSRI